MGGGGLSSALLAVGAGGVEVPGNGRGWGGCWEVGRTERNSSFLFLARQERYQSSWGNVTVVLFSSLSLLSFFVVVLFLLLLLSFSFLSYKIGMTEKEGEKSFLIIILIQFV